MTTTTPAAGTVLPLTAATDHRIAGRKAATLARLAAAGFPVPPGVVVPAAVLERPPGPEVDVPADVATDLLHAVRAWGDVPLAVRSSGKELRKAAQSQGYPAGLLYKHGAGDGAFYSGRGIAAVAFGVGGGGQHGPDEYVEIATIVPYYRALKEFLERLRSAADG